MNCCKLVQASQVRLIALHGVRGPYFTVLPPRGTTLSMTACFQSFTYEHADDLHCVTAWPHKCNAISRFPTFCLPDFSVGYTGLKTTSQHMQSAWQCFVQVNTVIELHAGPYLAVLCEACMTYDIFLNKRCTSKHSTGHQPHE